MSSLTQQIDKLTSKLPLERATFFVDADAMKQAVRMQLLKPLYNVSDLYHESGFFRWLATNKYFESLTLGVITFNALWISIDTDNNKTTVLLDAEPVFIVMENLFCAYFFFEWFVRYMAFKRKRNGLKDTWFMFDSALVFMMVTETWILTAIILIAGGSGLGGALGNAAVLRLLRLLRLSRLAKMLRSMPELMILIKGMVAASRSLFFTMCLLFVLIYIFAIAFTQLCAGTGTVAELQYFTTINKSMYTLLVHGTLLDSLTTVSGDIAIGNPVIFVVFYCFVCMSALMVMNMLIGVLCEVVSAVAATEKEEMMVNYVKVKMTDTIKCIDQDGDFRISKHEFAEIMQSPMACATLEEVGVDPVGLVDFVDFIFDDGDGGDKELDFSHFITVILEMRGSNIATVTDMMNLTKCFRADMKQLDARLAGRIPPRKKRTQPPTVFRMSQRHCTTQDEDPLKNRSSEYEPSSADNLDGVGNRRSIRHCENRKLGGPNSGVGVKPERRVDMHSPRGNAGYTSEVAPHRPPTEVLEALLMAVCSELADLHGVLSDSVDVMTPRSDLADLHGVLSESVTPSTPPAEVEAWQAWATHVSREVAVGLEHLRGLP